VWFTETLKEKEIANYNNSNNKRPVKINHLIELNYPVKFLSRDLGGGGGGVGRLSSCHNFTVEPWYNEVQRDLKNLFVKSRYFFIYFPITGVNKITRYTVI